jgi:hypothetical protein
MMGLMTAAQEASPSEMPMAWNCALSAASVAASQKLELLSPQKLLGSTTTTGVPGKSAL